MLSAKLNIEDHSELLNYLREAGKIAHNETVKSKTLTGGVSNRTVQVYLADGSSWVIKQALDKLRVEEDWFCSPDRIYFEAEAIHWLNQSVPDICPKLIFEDKAQHLLAMEAVHTPFENLKTVLMEKRPQLSYFEAAGTLLGKIHFQGLKEELIPKRLFDIHYFDTLRVEPYYLETIIQAEETDRFFKLLIADTSRDRYTFVHGDFSPKNLLVKDGGLILLDHEVAHFGDGTFDLGFFMAHLLSKANHRREYIEDFLTGIQVFYDSYLSQNKDMGIPREQRTVRHAVGCLLARVKGLSRLEYLTKRQQETQKDIALKLIDKTPITVNGLISEFKELINA